MAWHKARACCVRPLESDCVRFTSFTRLKRSNCDRACATWAWIAIRAFVHDLLPQHAAGAHGDYCVLLVGDDHWIRGLAAILCGDVAFHPPRWF